MFLPSSPALQRLHHLDQSSPDFPDRLYNTLRGKEYVHCEQNLTDDDLTWFIDYLDKALGCLDPCSPASRRCLRKLGNICGTRTILPTSYSLPSHLLQIDPEPFAFGGSGDVYQGVLDGSTVCIKRVRVHIQSGPQNPAKAFCQEAVIWKRLNHPNVLPLLGATIAPFQLISNWIPGGNLLEYIQRHPDADQLKLLSDVAEGLRYLHCCHVIHGDLKGANILVENSGLACIADFGLAKITQNTDSIWSTSCPHGFTMRWAAPEVLTKGEYKKKADIFSFAMVMIEVFTGAVPFHSSSSVVAMLAITKGRRPPRPTHPIFTEDLWALMRHCWDDDPHVRPKASEVLQILQTLDLPAWKQLISPTLPTNERIQLITFIFSDRHEIEVVDRLSGDDAQTFIDTIDEALDNLAPGIRRKCLLYLSRICGRQDLLPKSLPIPPCCDLTEAPRFAGEFGDVWKGQHNGQEVAVKVLRVPKSDLKQTRQRFCKEVVIWKSLHHQNILPLLGVTVTEDRFVMVSEWMMNGNINEYVKTRPDAIRLELLADVIKGLRYIHDQGVVHGDLNGSNILIDNNGHACLAGFSPLMTIPDEMITASSDSPSSTTQWVGGMRWSAPEVLKGGAPSKQTDIYSFAMVMIEVFSGAIPFSDLPPFSTIGPILQARRPPRPTHPCLTGRLWKLMQRCWDENPSLRPKAPEVLQVLLGSNPPPWKQLIDPTLSEIERLDLIKTIFSDRDEAEVFKYLSGNDAQAFIDVIDEVLDRLDNLPLETRKACLRSLYETCGREALLPKSLPIPLCYDPMETPHYCGALADVWKGRHDGQVVVAKALKVYRLSGLEWIRKWFCEEVAMWRILRHPNVMPLLGVTMTENPRRFVVVSEWMEDMNVKQFLQCVHVDRLKLQVLADVTKGLIHMHDRGVVHGNLKPLNIMIDKTGRAVLADFSLITLIPDQAILQSSRIDDGSVRWMGPELLDPENFGSSKRRPTKESDCYALGMVIYEVLTACAPFGANKSFDILHKVLRGERPERPQRSAGKLLTDRIWDVVQLCWKHEPSERASAKDVLLCLKRVPPIMDGEDDPSFTDSQYFSDESDVTESNPGSPVASSGSGPLDPSLDYPGVPPSPVIPRDIGRLPDPPQAGNLDEGWIDGWLARIVWNIFNIIVGQIHIL